MYRSAMIIGAVIVGGFVFMAMFPAIKTGMNVNTSGWLTFYSAIVKVLPYALTGLFLLWIFASLRSRN